MQFERKTVKLGSGRVALALAAALATWSCLQAGETSHEVRATSAALTGDPCPCEAGYVCAGDPPTCQPDCSVQACEAGYYCDWSTLLCAPYVPPPPPPPPPTTNDCNVTGCPTSYVCVNGACEPNGFPVTTGCQFDWECPSGEHCHIQISDGTCVSGGAGSACSSELDCDSGLQCGSDGTCVTGTDACRSSYDCRPGYECEGGQCKSV